MTMRAPFSREGVFMAQVKPLLFPAPLSDLLVTELPKKCRSALSTARLSSNAVSPTTTRTPFSSSSAASGAASMGDSHRRRPRLLASLYETHDARSEVADVDSTNRLREDPTTSASGGSLPTEYDLVWRDAIRMLAPAGVGGGVGVGSCQKIGATLSHAMCCRLVSVLTKHRDFPGAKRIFAYHRRRLKNGTYDCSLEVEPDDGDGEARAGGTGRRRVASTPRRVRAKMLLEELYEAFLTGFADAGSRTSADDVLALYEQMRTQDLIQGERIALVVLRYLERKLAHEQQLQPCQAGSSHTTGRGGEEESIETRSDNFRRQTAEQAVRVFCTALDVENPLFELDGALGSSPADPQAKVAVLAGWVSTLDREMIFSGGRPSGQAANRSGDLGGGVTPPPSSSGSASASQPAYGTSQKLSLLEALLAILLKASIIDARDAKTFARRIAPLYLRLQSRHGVAFDGEGTLLARELLPFLARHPELVDNETLLRLWRNFRAANMVPTNSNRQTAYPPAFVFSCVVRALRKRDMGDEELERLLRTIWHHGAEAMGGGLPLPRGSSTGRRNEQHSAAVGQPEADLPEIQLYESLWPTTTRGTPTASTAVFSSPSAVAYGKSQLMLAILEFHLHAQQVEDALELLLRWLKDPVALFEDLFAEETTATASRPASESKSFLFSESIGGIEDGKQKNRSSREFLQLPPAPTLFAYLPFFRFFHTNEMPRRFAQLWAVATRQTTAFSCLAELRAELRQSIDEEQREADIAWATGRKDDKESMLTSATMASTRACSGAAERKRSREKGRSGRSISDAGAEFLRARPLRERKKVCQRIDHLIRELVGMAAGIGRDSDPLLYQSVAALSKNYGLESKWLGDGTAGTVEDAQA